MAAHGRLELVALPDSGRSWLRQLSGNRHGRRVPKAEVASLRKRTFKNVLAQWSAAGLPVK